MSNPAAYDALDAARSPSGFRQRHLSINSDAEAEGTAYYKHAAAPFDYLPVNTMEGPPGPFEHLSAGSVKRRAKLSAARDSRFVHRERCEWGHAEATSYLVLVDCCLCIDCCARFVACDACCL